MRIWWRKAGVCLLAALMICTCTAGIGSDSLQETEEGSYQEVSTSAELPQENRLIVRTDADITQTVDPDAVLEVGGGYILSFDSQQECEEAAGILSAMDAVESAECDAFISICGEDPQQWGESALEETAAETELQTKDAVYEGADLSGTAAGESLAETEAADQAETEPQQTELAGDTDEPAKKSDTAAETGTITQTETETVTKTPSAKEVPENASPQTDETKTSELPESETEVREEIQPGQWRENADRCGKRLVVLIDTGSDNADASIDLTGEGLQDWNGHGTEMNDLILQAGSGSAYVVSVKALSSSGTGLVSDLYTAVSLAVQSKADVISLCVSAEDSGQMEGLKSQLQEAAQRGILVVCAAGNNGLEAEKYSPGNSGGVLTVGACDSLGMILPHSNYGKAIDCFCSASSTSEAAALVSGYLCICGRDGLSDMSAVFMPDEVSDPLAFEPGNEAEDGLFHVAADKISAGNTVKLSGGYNVGPAVSNSGSSYLAEYTFRLNGNPGYCGNINASYGMYSSASGTRNYVAGVYDFTDVGGRDVNYVVKQVYDKNQNYTYGGKTIDGTLLRKILYYSDGAPGASKFGWPAFEKGYAENSYVFSDLPGSNRDSDPNRGKYTKSNAYRMGVVSAACSYVWGQAMGLCTVNSSENYKTYVIGKRYVDKVKSMAAAPNAFTAYFAVLSDSYNLNNSMSYVQPILGWAARDTEQIRIRKIVASPSGMIQPSGYDRNKYYSPKGLVFGVYSDQACTKLAAKLTIGAADANGNYYSGWAELKHGTYYLKEIDNSANRNLKITKITASFQVEMNDTVYPDGKRTIDVTDEPVTGTLQIRKLVRDSSGTDMGSLYSAEGTKFALYTAESGGTKLADLTIGSRSSDGAFYSNTVKGIAYGTYYLQEVSIPKSLQDAGASLITSRVRCDIIPGKLNSSGVLISEITNKVEKPSIETSAADVKTGSNSTLCQTSVTLTDHVSFEKLVPGREYVMVGTLMDREKKEPLMIGNQQVTKQVTFTPEAASGTVDVSFTFDGSGLYGRKLCVFEQLQLDGKVMAEHKSFTDTKQQIDMSAPASIALTKYDNSGKKLSGVVFEITDKQGRQVTDCDGKPVQQMTTGKDGTVRFANLPYGNYQITEVKTQQGYSLLTEPLNVTLPVEYTEEEVKKEQVDTQNALYSPKEGKYYITQLQYSVSDSVTLKMPNAGSSKGLAWMSGILLIGGTVVCCSLRRRMSR